MKLRLINVLAVLVVVFTGCGQSSTPTVEGSPIDRHAGRLIYTRHAHCRMDCRHITEKEIREILEGGEINYRKSQPDGHPDAKYALEGYTKEGQHLRVIFAVPTGRPETAHSLVVITCIELGVEWQCDCK
ncbi:DUF4258 domain-containing protein [Flavitalea sp. BT771]|uniref:DUF4258 domain-containing protein n=1 Tax=Flavitalea sp. BT771 TaxID=3063329 RepID=UPI0026E39688|nr:DUF4258 domain-containing protein [Flavitalea sp. BT771]MDO6435422.1 DUF4258 domain-containing protein [Flavitalea sp. BT771]MDV6224218.1 DUF4258 domain-containing protein [Flavitalea sp. BT771]